MAAKKYMLEITMESKTWEGKQKYIKRSFPVTKRTLDISGYGYPYDKFGKVEIGELGWENSPHNKILNLTFDGKAIKVDLNGFTTVEHEDRHINTMAGASALNETINTTFYLYIE